MLQWGSIEGEVRRPELPPGILTPQEAWAPAGEDADAGPSTEVTQPLSWQPEQNTECDAVDRVGAGPALHCRRKESAKRTVHIFHRPS